MNQYISSFLKENQNDVKIAGALAIFGLITTIIFKKKWDTYILTPKPC